MATKEHEKMDSLIHRDLVYKIQGCVYDVYRELGHGFSEKIYENALLIELRSAGFYVKQQPALPAWYKDHLLGDFYADLIVEDNVLLELKAQQKLLPAHEAQILNYLALSKLRVGLLVNFYHPKATVKRFVR